MDQQHPIPQQISSYQFRLVGDMTLKQFFQLAGGALIALIFYAAPLPAFIKWPVIIFSSLLGVALAFLPFEERPLEKWIVAFFKSVYSPTIYKWQKTTTSPTFFKEEAPAPSEKIIAPKGQEALEEYLSVLPTQASAPLANLEKQEAEFLTKVSQIIYPGKETLPEPEVSLTAVSPALKEAGPVSGVAPTFSPESAPPSPPTQPNIIVGQVTDGAGKIVEGAILEIRDSLGIPVRALKSNKLGHFMIVTPLIAGGYQLIIEKEGYVFEPINFEAKGEIIPPIAVRGNSAPVAKVSEEVLTQPAAVA